MAAPVVENTPVPETVIAPAIPLKSPSKLPMILILGTLLLAFGTGGVLLGKQLSKLENIDPPFTATPTISSDPTLNWKTYVNPEFGFSFRYPQDYDETGVAGGRDLPIVALKHVSQDSTILVAESTKKFSMANLRSYAPTGQENIDPEMRIIGENTFYYYGPGGGGVAYPDQYFYNLVERNIIIQFSGNYDNDKTPDLASKALQETILSTFKSINPTVVSPTSKPVGTYNVPSSWTKVITSQNLNLCLPPKWELGDLGVVYNRDPGYITPAANISLIPYAGGSTREAYLQYWTTEYPNVRDLVSFKEIDINGNSALAIFATNDEQKTSPDGLAVLWYAKSKLWKAEVSGWNMVNDSQSNFLNDIYKMISCSF
jgi:hypothetical protein